MTGLMSGRGRTAPCGRTARAAAVLSMLAAACTPAQNGNVDQVDPPAAVVSPDSRITMNRLP